MALENIKLLYKSQAAVIKLYLVIILEWYLWVNTKQFMEKEYQVCWHVLARVAQVSYQ